MSATSLRETPPRPSAGGWEAYRATAFAIIEDQERGLKEARKQEARDANRGN